MLGDPEDLPKAEAVECGLLNMTVGARCATLVSGLRMLRDGAEIWARENWELQVYMLCPANGTPWVARNTLEYLESHFKKKTIPIPGEFITELSQV